MAPAMAAAAALLGAPCEADVDGGGAPLTACARVTLRFVHHPEWLQERAPLLLRDRGDCCVAGAGVVLRLAWDSLAGSD
jgi:hypothetical protein